MITDKTPGYLPPSKLGKERYKAVTPTRKCLKNEEKCIKIRKFLIILQFFSKKIKFNWKLF